LGGDKASLGAVVEAIVLLRNALDNIIFSAKADAMRLGLLGGAIWGAAGRTTAFSYGALLRMSHPRLYSEVVSTRGVSELSLSPEVALAVQNSSKNTACGFATLLRMSRVVSFC